MAKPSGISKIILGVGYSLATLIIIVNFLGQKVDPRQRSPGFPESQIPSDYGALKDQLDEKRRENSKLKEILDDLQGRFEGRPGFPELPSGMVFHTSIDPENALNEPIASVPLEIFRSRVESNPFRPGKNPYMPFYDTTPAPTPAAPIPRREGIVFRTDPRVPFLLMGNLVPTRIRGMTR